MEDGGRRVGGLLSVLPAAGRLAVAFAAVAGVGAVGLFGAVRGRFGGTAALPGAVEAALELDASAAGSDTSSSSRRPAFTDSCSLSDAMVISN